MFKCSLVALIIIALLQACRENSPNNSGMAVDSIRKVTDIPVDTASKHKSTLDSLQGTWVSNDDNNDFLMLQSHNHTEIYTLGGRSDTIMAEFYLSDSCEKDMGKLDIKKSTGNFMVLTMPDDPVNTQCYQIDYIDDKHLALLFHGKTLSYYKK